MQYGIIKYFDPIKGYGFILTDDEDEVYFSVKDIHPKSRQITPREGLKVGFDLKREMKGDRAVNVRFVK